MKLFPSTIRTAIAVAVVCGCASASAQEQVAIKGATIIPIKGDRIENGVILIRDGKITKVGGADVKVPVDATVIDGKGKVVMPGLINVHSAGAMSQANEQNAVVPFLSVIDSIDPQKDFFEESRRNGVTTAAVVPGNSTMIGGRAVIVKTAGSYVNDMVLKTDAGLKISMAPSSGRSRMSHYANLRKQLKKIKDDEKAAKEKAEEEKKKAEAEKKKAAADKDKKTTAKPAAKPSSAAQSETDKATKAALTSLLKGDLPAFIYCQNALDVTQALRIVDEYKLKAMFVVGRDAYKAAETLAKKKVPIILDSRLVSWRTNPRTRKDEKIVLPKIFRDKGAKFVFQVDDNGVGVGTHYHWYQAATAVRYGMPVNEALSALTLDAARMLGVDEFVGSIEEGKDADLVILNGDPLKVNTWVDTTLVNGKIVYERSKDTRLRRLFDPDTEKKDTE